MLLKMLPVVEWSHPPCREEKASQLVKGRMKKTHQEKRLPTRIVANEDATRTELQPFQVVADLDGLAKAEVDILFIVESESGLFRVNGNSRPFNPDLEVVSETLGGPNSTLTVQELSDRALELCRS